LVTFEPVSYLLETVVGLGNGSYLLC